jgi:hypothetical protein
MSYYEGKSSNGLAHATRHDSPPVNPPGFRAVATSLIKCNQKLLVNICSLMSSNDMTA